MKPVLQALVLAERVYQDVSGKKIIAGTFTGVTIVPQKIVDGQEVEAPDGTKARIIPGGTHGGSPFAYLSLTDVCEGTKLVLQFVQLAHNRVLLGSEVSIDCHDRLATVELVIPLPMLPFQGAGDYAFEVVCEGDILGSWRIKVNELKVE